MSTSSSSGPLLLYDGACGFCAASVQFILAHERDHALRFAALDSDAGREVRKRHPALSNVDSMIWVEDPGRPDERVLIRSAAALRVARYLGGAWHVALVAALIPRAIRDVVYDFIARHRHRLLSAPDRCYLPPSEVRWRFVDRAQ